MAMAPQSPLSSLKCMQHMKDFGPSIPDPVHCGLNSRNKGGKLSLKLDGSGFGPPSQGGL